MTETGAFGAWLRSCRQLAGLSQEALAGRAGFVHPGKPWLVVA
jgi:transcriptional regulator with XRE-family HTH domain